MILIDLLVELVSYFVGTKRYRQDAVHAIKLTLLILVLIALAAVIVLAVLIVIDLAGTPS